ncbi:carbohydrate ABC transporter permease [Pumilibacter intestinalis]|jgi:multiple sugar transport system permease protein|uniref:carbohydrate ABC transporter permease n=1 Tax=Pumilibacter intestinalis TaxID=2941511 RepID=UPI00203A4BE6|nr:sugar ABC transporter permease [Pumilibacter intestinalis]
MALLESLAKRKISRKSLFDRLGWFAFILPVVLGVLIFSLYPMVVSLYYSFFKTYTGTTDLPFWTINGFNNFGLFNYKRMFTIDSEVWQSFGITFIYAVVSVPVCLILSFLIALLLNSKVKGIGIFRVIYYLPVIIPTTINGLLWADFYDVRFGLANQLLTSVGLPAGTFFTSANTALVTFMSLNLWTLGASMILWLSALKNVPASLIESAKLDGAGAFRRLVKIIIPMCTPILFYNIITGVIGALQMFGPVMTLMGQSGAGPDNALYFFAYKIYNTAFGAWEMGYACALAWFLFLIIAALTGLAFGTNKWVYYGDGGND